MKIRKGGIYRVCTKEDYEQIYKAQGYEVVHDQVEEVAETKEIEVPTGNLEHYYKGGGWYEYKGKSYRRDELLEVIE